ncbi:hypothetical protein SAMN05216188_11890 [Lentzea xinjiangensis]|uniref:Uncharacterized protein n=1 Tax=Lentzea xinjiangensis TaxID=402600 RepID=A0A1H9TFV6_9PSEU|nr:hypothetical protein [Lentzea xinjiangensis]SER95927.1 hypothetical protein SAMN05216188_11890 [Lentzea xinjiangensis]
MAEQKYAGEPFSAGVAPEAGGEINVQVSGWGWWNVWIRVESYVDGFESTVMDPPDALRLARYLVRAAVVCAWKRRAELRHIRKMERKARRAAS